MNDQLQLAADAIQNASALWIGAGAGMGVDSGLPDFRGDEGFWKAYPPFRKLGLNFYDLADPRWFDDDPQRAWGFYGHRRNLYRATEPHAGFQTLLKWANRKASYFVFTSNVDGHFQVAGCDSDRVVECHGAINYSQCTGPCTQDIWESSAQEILIDEATMRASQPLPTCKSCGQIARPNILMFGDSHWLSSRSNQQHQRYQQWLNENRHQQIVGIEFGAGTAVPTVRWECQTRCDVFIRVNPREPETSSGNISLAMGAAEAISAIDQLLE